MRKETEDHRVRYTKMVLKDALLRLMGTKPLAKITVAELCADAKVSRGTFYHYYYDIYDIYEGMERELLTEIHEKLEKEKTYAYTDSFFRGITELIHKNAALAAIILQDKNSGLLKRIIDVAEQKFLSELREGFPNADEERIRQVFTYTVSGSIGILSEWLRAGLRCTPQEMAAQIERLNLAALETISK